MTLSTAKHAEHFSKIPWPYTCYWMLHMLEMHPNKNIELNSWTYSEFLSLPVDPKTTAFIVYPTTLGSERSWQEAWGLLHSLGLDYLPKGRATTTRRLFRHTEKQVNHFEEEYIGAGLPSTYYYFSLTPIFGFTAHILVKMPLCKKTLHTRKLPSGGWFISEIIYLKHILHCSLVSQQQPNFCWRLMN